MANTKKAPIYTISCGRFDEMMDLFISCRPATHKEVDASGGVVDHVGVVDKDKAFKVLTQCARRVIARRRD